MKVKLKGVPRHITIDDRMVRQLHCGVCGATMNYLRSNTQLVQSWIRQHAKECAK